MGNKTENPFKTDREDKLPHILFVNDIQRIADVCARELDTYLEEALVETAYGGTETLEKVDESVDIVFLNGKMPDLHGFEVAERLRNRGYDGVIIYHSVIEPDVDVTEYGMQDFLICPIDSDNLFETAEKWL